MKKEQEYSIPLRAYSKQELAQCYFPNCPVEVAQQHLRRWIRNCKALVRELESTGMQKKCRMYTPKQVKVIMEYLGEP
jgi:hypothetical protein